MKESKKLKEYLTIQDVIQIFGISSQTFYLWRKEDHFKNLEFRKVDNKLRLHSRDFLDYIHSRINNKDCVKITDPDLYYKSVDLISRSNLANILRIHKWTLANWNVQKFKHRVPHLDVPCSLKYRVVDVNMWLNKYLVGESTPPDISKDVFLLPKEACSFLGISYFTLAKWRKLKKIPYIKIGHSTRFRLSDINSS